MEKCVVLELPFELDGFDVIHVIFEAPCETLWWNDLKPMREATRISKECGEFELDMQNSFSAYFEDIKVVFFILKLLWEHLAELATQKMHESATKIAALTRGVLVRRTFFLSLSLTLSFSAHTHQKNRHKRKPKKPVESSLT